MISDEDANGIFFACIGTDRSTGDSLGPLVGTKLALLGYNVIGTIDNPLHAENLAERLAVEIPFGMTTVIAIDASLGMSSSVGKVYVKHGPLKPGTGVGKNLPPVGQYHITGVVNVGGFMEYFVLQNTRLSLVMNMADQIVQVIQGAVPLPEQHSEQQGKVRSKLISSLKSFADRLWDLTTRTLARTRI